MNGYFYNAGASDPDFALKQGDYRVASCVEDAPPASEPITLDEAKNHLRVDTNDDDTNILALITVARTFVEDATGRAFITRVFICTFDGWPRGVLRLPRSKATVINWVKYLDNLDAEQTVDPSVYSFDLRTEPARVFVKVGQWWPPIIPRPSVVRVSFAAGAADASGVDKRDITAMKLVLGHLYENREAGIVGTIADLLPMGIKAFIGQRQVPTFT